MVEHHGLGHFLLLLTRLVATVATVLSLFPQLTAGTLRLPALYFGHDAQCTLVCGTYFATCKQLFKHDKQIFKTDNARNDQSTIISEP